MASPPPPFTDAAPHDAAPHAPPRTQQHRKRWLLEASLIFAFWTVLALLTLGHAFLSPRGAGTFNWTTHQAIRAFGNFYLWALVTPLGFWLCRRFPLDEKDGLRNVLLHVLFAFFAAFLVDLAGDVLRRWLRPDRGFAHFRIFRDVLDLRIIYELTIYLAILAAGFARSYFLRLRQREAHEDRLEARADRLQRQLTEARLQALRMQLNPHFLFNTLHAVSALVGEDPAGVRRMIARLSELLRHVLEEAGPGEVPLHEEMKFLRAYFDIMQIRFQGRLDVDLDAPPETEAALVPHLILQPLVENAIKHGAGEVMEGPGRVVVRARRRDRRLHVEVQDNGPRFSEGDTPALEVNTGLENVRARLREVYGSDAALVFRTAGGGGLVAAVHLPYHTAADLRTQARAEPVGT